MYKTKPIEFEQKQREVRASIDTLIQEIKADQAAIDHRTEVIQRAEALICECRFTDAIELLDIDLLPAAEIDRLVMEGERYPLLINDGKVVGCEV